MGALPTAVFAVVGLTTALVYPLVVRWLASVSEVQDFTAAQFGCAVGYGIVLSLWLAAEAGFCLFKMSPKYDPVDSESGEENSCLSPSPTGEEKVVEPVIFGVSKTKLKMLRAAGEFSLWMGYVYLCDRTTLIAKGPKEFSKARFWGLNALILVAGLFSLRKTPHGGDEPTMKPLQRDQTEEWKGWMQIMFILYHYFAEAEIYNAIRLYIAAYVWMTDFGNFSYYYIRRDFTFPRFAQMMWRLNFFVFFVCVTMNNEYMLYYICPMHTFFTWLVFFACWAGNQWNDSNLFCFAKIGVTLGLTLVLYHVPGLFDSIFGPFRWLLEFHDPLHPEITNALHEWSFRSGLDHVVWIFGMLCAFSFPWYDQVLQAVEGQPTPRRLVSKTAIVGVVLAVLGYWYANYFTLPKRSYNGVHPYTSWIPILGYIILRNMSLRLRRYSMELFAWCGKVTLETYILQFHIWMKTTGLNGSPKHLMVWVPGWYWTNMALTSAVFLFVSNRIFKLTVILRDECIPKDTRGILVRMVAAAAALAGLFGVGSYLKPVPGLAA